MSYLFALISQTKLVRTSDLFRLSRALEQNAADCARAWGKAPPAIVVCDVVEKLPLTAQPVVFLDNGTDPSALAIHYWDPLRGPAARVFVESASGFNTGDHSVCESASHEILEALVDPMTRLWADHPDPARKRQHVQMALEVADPVQDHYTVQCNGTDWKVSNFVTPQYFDPGFNDLAAMQTLRKHGGSLDFMGNLKKPGEIGPFGYAVLRKPDPAGGGGYLTWLENASGSFESFATKVTAAKRHTWARTHRRQIAT